MPDMASSLRIAILGNSGSGKSTLARWVGERLGVPVLDLDTIAWEPDRIAVARDPEAALRDLRAFAGTTSGWITEGCYSDLTRGALELGAILLLLDPGEAVCRANCRSRPWEPHKYPSKEEQDARLEALLAWVSDAYRRDGDLSHAEHCRVFDEFAGRKLRLTEQVNLARPPSALVDWLDGMR